MTACERCQRIASVIVHHRGNVGRIARFANKSPESWTRNRHKLTEAKAYLAEALAARESHLTECPTMREMSPPHDHLS